MFNSGDSKLIELPPEMFGRDRREIQHTSIVRASSADELLGYADMDSAVLDRVLYRGDRFGAYRILGFIAAGGMGEVYAAERVSQGARRLPVALKVLSQSSYGEDQKVLMRQFEREAVISSKAQSKHVVDIYEYGYDDKGRGFMAMELLDGEELFDRIKKHKMFPLRVLAQVSLQVLRGLDAIHKAGVVHRDIKPENIFLAHEQNGKEVVKILDFGIARYGQDTHDPLLQKPGQIFGTPQYLSPEQSRTAKVDHRSDIYSLGVVMYECVSGSPLFDRETPYATMLAHQEEPVPPLPSTLHPEFCEIIYKALTKTPETRWQSAEEMHGVLARWVNETSWVDDALPGASRGWSGAGGLSVEDLLGARVRQTPFLGVPSMHAQATSKDTLPGSTTSFEHDGLFSESEELLGHVPVSAQTTPSSGIRSRQASSQLMQPQRQTPLEDTQLLEEAAQHIRASRVPGASSTLASASTSRPKIPIASEFDSVGEASSMTRVLTIVAVVIALSSLVFIAFYMTGMQGVEPTTQDAFEEE